MAELSAIDNTIVTASVRVPSQQFTIGRELMPGTHSDTKLRSQTGAPNIMTQYVEV